MATNDKYDRQLRLWGANGQRALMNANILLVNADSVGTETLKNLVLPGVGSFTILDDFIVDHNDLGCNFFTTSDHLHKPRADIVKELLCEMNGDVKGFAKIANFQNVFKTDPEYFASFSLIITANLAESHLTSLSEFCWERKIPLLVVKSYGMIGSVRLQLKDHEIIETRGDTDRFDLRISNPFPELIAYCDNIDLNALSSLEHSHVPYIVLLYKAIQLWKQQHNGSNPQSFGEKEEFKKLIKSLSHDYNNELNFQEAVRESYRAYTIKEASSEVQTLIEQQSNAQLTNTSSDFDFMVRALELFIATTHTIPLNGQIPDLTSTTDLYVQLQQLYQQKAQQDLTQFTNILNQLLQTHANATRSISSDNIELFFKNAPYVTKITTRSLTQEYAASESNIESMLVDDLYEDDPLQTPALWYLSLRAVDRFYKKYARYPGEKDDENVTKNDAREVYEQLKNLVKNEYGLSNELLQDDGEDDNDNNNGETASIMKNDDDVEGSTPPSKIITKAHAIEITRYGGCELHTISAVIGGIASQEAVKVIAHQYMPIDNTYVYNGIASVGATYVF